MSRDFLNGKVRVFAGDSREVLAGFADDSFDSVVTDPPYALVSIVKRFGSDDAAACKVPENGTGAYARASAGFMGQKWDTGETAFAPAFWAEVLRVLKPGGHILAFSGTRTYHRLACAIEDAGFEIRDMVSWLYGSGFPKSHNAGKAITAHEKTGGSAPRNMRKARQGGDYVPTGQENWALGRSFGQGQLDQDGRETEMTDSAQGWQGWGTALKPALEPIVLARKPLIGTVAANVLKHGTGAINIDGCRVETDDNLNGGTYSPNGKAGPMPGDERTGAALGMFQAGARPSHDYRQPSGRWPANVIHDGSEEVTAGFPESVSQSGGNRGMSQIWGGAHGEQERNGFDDSGSAARFFYTPKADSDDRIGSKHPTVKPVDLMRYLCRLITPPGGMVLDPFAGTGTTGEAAFYEGFRATLIEREAEYMADIERRMELCMAGPEEKNRAIIKAKGLMEESAGPLFDGL